MNSQFAVPQDNAPYLIGAVTLGDGNTVEVVVLSHDVSKLQSPKAKQFAIDYLTEKSGDGRYGYDRSSAVCRALSDGTVCNTLDLVKEATEQVKAGEKPLWAVQIRIRSADGRPVTV